MLHSVWVCCVEVVSCGGEFVLDYIAEICQVAEAFAKDFED